METGQLLVAVMVGTKLCFPSNLNRCVLIISIANYSILRVETSAIKSSLVASMVLHAVKVEAHNYGQTQSTLVPAILLAMCEHSAFTLELLPVECNSCQ